MNGFQRVAVILAGTAMLTTLVLPGRTTAKGITAAGGALSQWTRATEGLSA